MTTTTRPRRKARAMQRAESYFVHAQRHGDCRTVFETAWEEMQAGAMTAREVGFLAARLRRLASQRPANSYRNERGKIVYLPAFRLTEAEKRDLTRRLIREGVAVKTICTYVATTPPTVAQTTSDLDAEKRAQGLLADGPVDLLAPECERTHRGIVGSGSSSRRNGPARLSGKPSLAPGQRFGRLVVERVEHNARGRERRVYLRCDCGGTTDAKPSHIRSGGTQSCGCLRRDRVAAMRAARGGRS